MYLQKSVLEYRPLFLLHESFMAHLTSVLSRSHGCTPTMSILLSTFRKRYGCVSWIFWLLVEKKLCLPYNMFIPHIPVQHMHAALELES